MTASPQRNVERKSKPIPVWNGILEHRDRIGEALWEFLWRLDRVTVERDGAGLIFGGVPVKLERIVADLNGDKETVRRHLKKLEAGKYIRVRRTPYGQVIAVLKSKKFGIWRPWTEKPQSAVSHSQRNRDSQPLKLIHESEKPQSAVSKEDPAVDPTRKQRQQPAIAVPNLGKEWVILGVDFPIGPFLFQDLWKNHYESRKSGETLSRAMEQCLQAWQSQGRKCPPPFIEAKRAVEQSEKTRQPQSGDTWDAMPVASPNL